MHELGPLPWSLASFNESLAKTNKAALPKLLENGVDSLQHLPVQTSACSHHGCNGNTTDAQQDSRQIF